MQNDFNLTNVERADKILDMVTDPYCMTGFMYGLDYGFFEMDVRVPLGLYDPVSLQCIQCPKELQCHSNK